MRKIGKFSGVRLQALAVLSLDPCGHALRRVGQRLVTPWLDRAPRPPTICGVTAAVAAHWP